MMFDRHTGFQKDLTVACLESLGAQRVDGVVLEAFVLDDASSDGTGAAVAERFPEVTLLRGTGSLYWNGGRPTRPGRWLNAGQRGRPRPARRQPGAAARRATLLAATAARRCRAAA